MAQTRLWLDGMQSTTQQNTLLLDRLTASGIDKNTYNHYTSLGALDALANTRDLRTFNIQKSLTDDNIAQYLSSEQAFLKTNKGVGDGETEDEFLERIVDWKATQVRQSEIERAGRRVPTGTTHKMTIDSFFPRNIPISTHELTPIKTRPPAIIHTTPHHTDDNISVDPNTGGACAYTPRKRSKLS